MKQTMIVLLAFAASLGAGSTVTVEAIPTSRAPAASIAFEENKGQAGSDVRFFARSAGGFLAFDDHGVSATSKASGITIRLSFPGASKQAHWTGDAPRPGLINYMRGSDPRCWTHGVRTYDAVVLRDAYPGLDIRFHAMGGEFEYDVLVAPGANPRAFALTVSGASELRIDDAGRLLALRPDSSEQFVQQAPVAWQDAAGRREPVTAKFVLDAGLVRFEVGAYDRSRPLVIDPVLLWANFIGGSETDTITGDAMVVDPNGNVIIAGPTHSTNFPTTPPSPSYAGGFWDTYITKFSADGSTLLWSTLVGGDQHDLAVDMTLDPTGNIVVVGWTLSTNFPTTAGAFMTTHPGGPQSGFVMRINATTGAIMYSSFVGGSGGSVLRAVAMGPSGTVYAAGWGRGGFPTTSGAYDQTHAGGAISHVVMVVMNLASGGASDLLYSTYIGGTVTVLGGASDIAVDASGDAYLVGNSRTQKSTNKTPIVNYPVTQNAFLKTLNLQNNTVLDAPFLSRIHPVGAGSADLVYSTWLAPNPSYGSVRSVCLSPSGLVCVAGTIPTAGGMTTTANAYDTTHNGQYDGFVNIFNTSLSGAPSRVYSTFIGGNGHDEFNDVNIDATGRLLLTGTTHYLVTNVHYPTTSGAVQTTTQGVWDVVVSILDVTQTGSAQLIYSTLFGGTGGPDGADVGHAIAKTPDGGIAVACTFEATANYPAGVSWPYDGTLNGVRDAGLLRFAP